MEIQQLTQKECEEIREFINSELRCKLSKNRVASEIEIEIVKSDKGNAEIEKQIFMKDNKPICFLNISFLKNIDHDHSSIEIGYYEDTRRLIENRAGTLFMFRFYRYAMAYYTHATDDAIKISRFFIHINRIEAPNNEWLCGINSIANRQLLKGFVETINYIEENKEEILSLSEHDYIARCIELVKESTVMETDGLSKRVWVYPIPADDLLMDIEINPMKYCRKNLSLRFTKSDRQISSECETMDFSLSVIIMNYASTIITGDNNDGR